MTSATVAYTAYTYHTRLDHEAALRQMETMTEVRAGDVIVLYHNARRHGCYRVAKVRDPYLKLVRIPWKKFMRAPKRLASIHIGTLIAP
jgi:hypothetical protein